LDRVQWLLEGITSAGPAVASSILFAAFGGLIAWLIGLRTPLLLIAAAVPTGIAAFALAAQALGAVGIRTTFLVDALVALLAASVIGAARRLWIRRTDPGEHEDVAAGRIRWAGAAVGGLVALAVWLAGIGDFAIPPQGNDDIWHGYLVERLTHMPAITAGTVAPSFADSTTPVVYYQYGLHLAAAVVHEVTGVSVAEALNGAWIVYVGLLLPFGIAALAWRLFPADPWVAFWAAAISASLAIFPYLTNGILPYTAALAMVPGLLALVVSTVDRRPHPPAAVVALVGLAVFVTHPSAAVAAAVLALFLTADQLLRRSTLRDRLFGAWRLATVGVLGIVITSPWLLVSGEVGLGTGITVAAVDGLDTAGAMLLGFDSPWTSPQPLFAGLCLLGVLVSLSSGRGIGITLGLLIFGGLYVGALAGMEDVSPLASPWHGDWHRLAAVVGLVAPVLAGLAIATVLGWWRRLMTSWRRPVLIVLAVVIGLPPLAVTAYYTAQAQSIVRTAWHVPRLVTDQDVALFRALADRAGPADKVLNSPVDGSTWMYALFEVVPVLPYSAGPNLNLPRVYRGAGEQADPAVACRTLAATGATYALVKFVRGNDPGGNDVAMLVSRFPDLFTVVGRSESGVAYRIEPAELARCASG
jgi:hypothetical protein